MAIDYQIGVLWIGGDLSYLGQCARSCSSMRATTQSLIPTN